ncbi:hypothetical protein Vau01_010880 [Virgisporangium aurantiacum]|uniref:Uncharacterized protein n=1 Tax=Virgisporangium aurantiacum TaxID=175570 RepID=A0A8J3YZR3_9ACTN|nr:hypothetical protein Vau01_010880 [Virgisporangium aurantiacum]
MGTARGIVGDVCDQKPPTGAWLPRQRHGQVVDSDQPLLKRRNDERGRLMVGGRPLRGVDDRTSGHGARWRGRSMEFVGSEQSGAVNHRERRRVVVTQATGQQRPSAPAATSR